MSDGEKSLRCPCIKHFCHSLPGKEGRDDVWVLMDVSDARVLALSLHAHYRPTDLSRTLAGLEVEQRQLLHHLLIAAAGHALPSFASHRCATGTSDPKMQIAIDTPNIPSKSMREALAPGATLSHASCALTFSFCVGMCRFVLLHQESSILCFH